MSRLLGFVALGVAAGLIAARPAAAQVETDSEGRMVVFGQRISGHILVGVKPKYLGSDEFKFAPSGSITLLRPGEDRVFTAPDDGFALSLVGDRSLSAGVVARWRSDRSNHGDLQGLDKIDWAVEAGGFVTWWPSDWLRLRGEVRRGFGGNEAWAAMAGADAVHDDGVWEMSIGPRFRWADDSFSRTYFRVTPLEALRSPNGISAFAADDNYFSAGLMASVEYQWRPRWSITADAQYERILGDAADSPLVDQLGSADQFSAAIGLRHAF